MRYNELSDEAKAKAREWYTSGDYPDHEWWDYVYENFREVTKCMGITVEDMNFNGFWSQGDGARWRGSWYPQKGMVKAVKDYTGSKSLHDIAVRLSKLQRAHMFQLRGYISFKQDYYCHEYTMAAEMERDSHRNQPPNDKAEEEFLEIARELARWLYGMLEDEYNSIVSEEYVADMIIDNDYEFDEDGSPA